MTSAQPDILALSSRTPLAEGASRWVYPHPNYSGRLIKVLKHWWLNRHATVWRQPGKVLKSRFKFVRFMREVEQLTTAAGRGE